MDVLLDQPDLVIPGSQEPHFQPSLLNWVPHPEEVPARLQAG